MVEADKATAQGQERLLQVGPAFIADRAPANARQPGEGPLDRPAMPPQPGAGVDPAAGDARADVATAQFRAAVPVIVRLVGVELHGALAAPTLRRAHP